MKRLSDALYGRHGPHSPIVEIQSCLEVVYTNKFNGKQRGRFASPVSYPMFQEIAGRRLFRRRQATKTDLSLSLKEPIDCTISMDQ
jgi:hypothetical protein